MKRFNASGNQKTVFEIKGYLEAVIEYLKFVPSSIKTPFTVYSYRANMIFSKKISKRHKSLKNYRSNYGSLSLHAV